MIVYQNCKWHMHRVSSSLSHVPPVPGIYAIGSVNKKEGLEEARTYVYIGITKNLRQRFKEHSPNNEPKRDLKRYLQAQIKIAQFWYTTDLDEENLPRLEKVLVAYFKPKYNVLLKK